MVIGFLNAALLLRISYAYIVYVEIQPGGAHWPREHLESSFGTFWGVCVCVGGGLVFQSVSPSMFNIVSIPLLIVGLSVVP